MTTGDAISWKSLRSTREDERERAERELYQHYEPRIRTVLSRIVGPGAILDDAVQETFVDIFSGLAHFEGRSRLDTWIYRVTLRRGWKVSKRESRRRANPLDKAAALFSRNASPSETAESRELAERLQTALTKLDFDQRSVLALSACHDLSPTEIAETLGIAVGTVHSRLSRARSKLERLLGIE